ncbi:MAG TPA: protoheme IX farnesyltransferase [Deltaproteobacteria bacterium]|nr:protoheme IX farnesyltransferase [Deltaproteobacteria bacterium]HCP44623.1 protoheme IX farnesyltransferase [Deltaproteobacteria bacterium]|tara:strand:+ start:346 stop:1254 length:909 start_codon:yes stop_codon:yes gene_type:complete
MTGSTHMPGNGAKPSVARDLVALTKPKITAMNVLMALGGMGLAGVTIDNSVVFYTVLGTSLVVAAANVLNMWWEREGDKLMVRTANRPLPAGRLDPALALAFGCVLSAVSIVLLYLQVNLTTAVIGLIALLLYVGVYTPLKRRTPLSLLIGAVPGAAPPLMGWTACRPELTYPEFVPGLLLFLILLLWQLPHFLAISLFRKADYARAGVRTVPVVRGDRVAKAQAVAWTTALVPISLLMIPVGAASWLYGMVALGLGLWFGAWAVRGLREDSGDVWARGFFRVSLIYLPALALALVLDHSLL